jgi:hypothetical protein
MLNPYPGGPVLFQSCPLLDEMSSWTYDSHLPVVGYSSLPLPSDQTVAYARQHGRLYHRVLGPSATAMR